MNYYIKGDAAKADQINAAFKKLGYDTSGHLFNANSVLYFTLDGEIRATTCNCTPAIIKTHPDYKELELPVKPKFNDGDVLVTTKIRSCPFIYRKPDFNNDLAYYYVGIDGNGDLSIGWPKRTLCHFGLIADAVIAGQGQRDLLFKKMKEAGYQWDAEKKELRKIKPHYDISNFNPFDKVLVRCSNDEEWMIEFYCKYDTLVHTSPHRDYPFMGIGDSYSQCIPYEGNEHLLGTTDMCEEKYINW